MHLERFKSISDQKIRVPLPRVHRRKKHSSHTQQQRNKKNSPHGCAVEVHHHPLRGIEGERLGVFYARHEVAKLGAYESRAGIGSIYVHPDIFRSTCKNCSRNVYVLQYLLSSERVLTLHRHVLPQSPAVGVQTLWILR